MIRGEQQTPFRDPLIHHNGAVEESTAM